MNWTILTDGDAVTLIDAGYPGDLDGVLHSLTSIGHRPEQVAAILLTHAHIDHIGSLPGLARHGCSAPVLASPSEARHARREYLASRPGRWTSFRGSGGPGTSAGPCTSRGAAR